MKKKGIILLVFTFTNIVYAQLSRGVLIFENTPSEVLTLIENQQINLTQTRNVVDFITNNTITTYKKQKLSKRKKALVRHVKMLNEQLEYRYFSGEKTSLEDLEILFEFLLIQQSIINDAQSPSGGTPALWKKAHMFLTSKKRLSVPIPKAYKASDYKVLDSPYWNYVDNREKMLARFDDLAKIKKIKPKKELVVLFKELSYSGSAPKIRTLDTDYDNEWSLKWGDEVHSDVVGSRIFSALGYDTDHPYFYGQDQLILVFESSRTILNTKMLTDSLKHIYNFDLGPFISKTGSIDSFMIQKNKALKPYMHHTYVTFVKCAVEARPDRVKRLGSFCPNQFNNPKRKELRGALLAHIWIGNWDTREENTLLTIVHQGNYKYQISAVFSDLGTSMGVHINLIRSDFKTGLVNAFEWGAAHKKRNKISFNHALNALLKPYRQVTYDDLYWMAEKIALFDEQMLRDIIKNAGWPYPIAELYFHKLASRRASILKAFTINDPNPIPFDKNLNITENGVDIVKNGFLMVDYERQKNPESFFYNQGRMRNYGN